MSSREAQHVTLWLLSLAQPVCIGIGFYLCSAGLSAYVGGNGAWAEKVPNGKAGINAPPLFDDNADDFLCGTAISVYQNSGGPDSNWGAFENQRRWFSSRISVCAPI